MYVTSYQNTNRKCFCTQFKIPYKQSIKLRILKRKIQLGFLKSVRFWRKRHHPKTLKFKVILGANSTCTGRLKISQLFEGQYEGFDGVGNISTPSTYSMISSTHNLKQIGVTPIINYDQNSQLNKLNWQQVQFHFHSN